jgi:hypothetical protein
MRRSIYRFEKGKGEGMADGLFLQVGFLAKYLGIDSELGFVSKLLCWSNWGCCSYDTPHSEFFREPGFDVDRFTF